MGVGGDDDGADKPGTAAIPEDDMTIIVFAASCRPRFNNNVCSNSSSTLWFKVGAGALDQQ